MEHNVNIMTLGMPRNDRLPPFPVGSFQQRFPDGRRSRAAYEAILRWPAGFVCPACGSSRGWAFATKAYTLECADCRKQTSVTAGTVMHAPSWR